MFETALSAGTHTAEVKVAQQKHEKSLGTAARILQFVVNGSAAGTGQ